MIKEATIDIGFSMQSDMLTCSLLKTLAGTKPGGRFLEIGTGTGLSAAWILEGMDKSSTLISIDNDVNCLKIATRYLGNDKRLELIHADGGDWIAQNLHQKFDFIFADSWHGKYLLLDEVLSMLKPGGIYVVDDMLPQANWPEGHDAKAKTLIRTLDNRQDLVITHMEWATGIIVCSKK